MDFKAIENIIKTMDDSRLGYLEVNWQDISIIMKKEGERGNISQVNFVKGNESKENDILKKYDSKKKDKDNGILGELSSDKKEKSVVGEDNNIKNVISPIVGTFYSSPNPGKPAFVSIGSKVKKGDTLCVIEAMKLMNEIQTEADGEVVEILAKDKQMVEYGETLFKIRTNI
ncbi:acetyl-CoA carboxylase biotin carboxyl carrier protein [Clostridium sp. JNZ X4-2]